MISELVIKDELGPGNVPKAMFITSIEEFVGDNPILTILDNIQILNRKYKIMENSIRAQQECLAVKIPDIELAIETAFQRKKLLANTVLEYPLEEAIEVLRSNLATAKSTIKLYQDSLDFIREQITILDVNTARIHNYGVMQRKSKSSKI
ncbi:Prefoldin subunit family protein [Cryptosporidium felis]|nr:Prefoldin subunit family protein [Cryptosporidium felis]